MCVCIYIYFESKVVLFLNTSFIYRKFYPDNKHPEDLYDASLCFCLGCWGISASEEGPLAFAKASVLRLQESFGKTLALWAPQDATDQSWLEEATPCPA